MGETFWRRISWFACVGLAILFVYGLASVVML